MLWQRGTLLWTPHQLYMVTFSLHWSESSWGRAGPVLMDTDPACFGMTHRSPCLLGLLLLHVACAPRGLVGCFPTWRRCCHQPRAQQEAAQHGPCTASARPGTAARCSDTDATAGACAAQSSTPTAMGEAGLHVDYSQNQDLKVQDSLCPHVQASSAPSPKCPLGSVTLGASSPV